MSDAVTRIINAYLQEKEANKKEGFNQQDRTPSPYVVPHSQMMEQYPYYTDQEVTDNHLQLDSLTDTRKKNDDAKEKHDKQFQYPEQDWQNVDWAGSGKDFLAPYENNIQEFVNRTPNSPMNLYDPMRGASQDIVDLNSRTADAIDGFLDFDKKYIKVSSMDLEQFMKVSDETLIHKSNKDLWKMVRDKEGNVYISRLFEDDILTD